MTGRTCGECGRTCEAAVVPMDASQELATCLRLAANVCLWCFDKKMLAGGFEPPRLEERWSPEDLSQLRAEAYRLSEKLRLDWRMRKLERERERQEKTQAVLA